MATSIAHPSGIRGGAAWPVQATWTTGARRIGSCLQLPSSSAPSWTRTCTRWPRSRRTPGLWQSARTAPSSAPTAQTGEGGLRCLLLSCAADSAWRAGLGCTWVVGQAAHRRRCSCCCCWGLLGMRAAWLTLPAGSSQLALLAWAGPAPAAAAPCQSLARPSTARDPVHARRRVRIWRFATGKLRRTYDESPEAAATLQREGPKHLQLEPIDFGRRQARRLPALHPGAQRSGLAMPGPG